MEDHDPLSLVCWNVNGLRAICSKFGGLQQFLEAQNAGEQVHGALVRNKCCTVAVVGLDGCFTRRVGVIWNVRWLNKWWWWTCLQISFAFKKQSLESRSCPEN